MNWAAALPLFRKMPSPGCKIISTRAATTWNWDWLNAPKAGPLVPALTQLRVKRFVDPVALQNTDTYRMRHSFPAAGPMVAEETADVLARTPKALEATTEMQ